jgi:hypothetical protein
VKVNVAPDTGEMPTPTEIVALRIFPKEMAFLGEFHRPKPIPLTGGFAVLEAVTPLVDALENSVDGDCVFLVSHSVFFFGFAIIYYKRYAKLSANFQGGIKAGAGRAVGPELSLWHGVCI